KIDASADNAPEHVAAALIARNDSIGQEKRNRPRMVRDDPVRAVDFRLGPLRMDSESGRGINKGVWQICLIIAGDTRSLVLQDRCNALEAGACVNVRRW